MFRRKRVNLIELPYDMAAVFGFDQSKWPKSGDWHYGAVFIPNRNWLDGDEDGRLTSDQIRLGRLSILPDGPLPRKRVPVVEG